MNSTVLKSSLLFCVKCASFSVIFWLIWLKVVQPINLAAQNQNASSQEAPTNAQMEAYERQMDRATRQLDMADDQQRRMEQYLNVQLEHAKRLDAILTVWEKQAGLRP